MLLIVFIVQRCFGVPRPVLLFYPMLLATHTQADWNWLLKGSRRAGKIRTATKFGAASEAIAAYRARVRRCPFTERRVP